MRRVQTLQAWALALGSALTALPALASIDAVRGPIPYASLAQVYSPPGLPGSRAAAEIEAAGYVVEEYFVAGKGDVYAPGAERPRLERSAVPYVTRLLVVRPGDAKSFNGIVHLTGTHPFQGGVQWNWASRLVLGSGAAYVAVGTGTDANSRSQSTAAVPVAGPDVTRWFNPERYGALQWPDDDGIRWTVFSDAARLLREANRPVLKDLKIDRVYASGWSFLGSFQRTYINEGFHDLFRRADGGPLIDGYMIGISSPWQKGGYLPISSREPPPDVGSPRRQLRPIDVPVIELMSQNEGAFNTGAQLPDKDEGKGRHRIYELGGTSHRDLGVSEVRSYSQQLRERGHPGGRQDPVCEFGDSDVPLRLLFSATMDNLHRWVTDGLPPPPTARLVITRAQEVARDASGNPLGGVRNVQLDLPLARYGTPPARLCTNVVPQYIAMFRMPFDAEELRRLYPGGKAEYLDKANRRVQDMIQERWIRSVDADIYRRQVASEAERAFSK